YYFDTTNCLDAMINCDTLDKNKLNNEYDQGGVYEFDMTTLKTVKVHSTPVFVNSQRITNISLAEGNNGEPKIRVTEERISYENVSK
ncbi:MAG: hypothetical protein WCK31_02835, partial [bacterium]